jgi:hypothetical protein
MNGLRGMTCASSLTSEHRIPLQRENLSVNGYRLQLNHPPDGTTQPLETLGLSHA